MTYAQFDGTLSKLIERCIEGLLLFAWLQVMRLMADATATTPSKRKLSASVSVSWCECECECESGRVVCVSADTATDRHDTAANE